MRTHYVLAACLGVVFFGIGYIAGKYVGVSQNSGDNPASARENSADHATGAMPKATPPEPSAVENRGAVVGVRFVPPEQYCNGDMLCLHSPLTARSAADFAWLRKHGYPTREDLERFALMSDVQLQNEANTGALPATVAWADRLISSGDPAKGFDLLITASQRGSIYAYYVTSAHTLNRKSMGGRVEAAAFLRIAYLLGDDMAAGEFYVRYGDYAPAELAAVDSRAASLYRTYAQNRPRSPRPQE